MLDANLTEQLRGHHRLRQGVEIRQEEQALALVLHRHPLLDRAEVVAEVEVAGRLDAGDDSHVHSFVSAVRARRFSRVLISSSEKAPVTKQATP